MRLKYYKIEGKFITEYFADHDSFIMPVRVVIKKSLVADTATIELQSSKMVRPEDEATIDISRDDFESAYKLAISLTNNKLGIK